MTFLLLKVSGLHCKAVLFISLKTHGAPKNFYSSGAISRKTAKILLDDGNDSHEESYRRVVHERPAPTRTGHCHWKPHV